MCFRTFTVFFALAFPFCLSGQIVAHAHNDYEHRRPLLDALQYGFTEVEADVHLIGGELYVYHDRPARPDTTRTLRNLYLRPLQAHIRANGGQVYPGYHDFFYLMIDFKTDGAATYLVLKKQLEEFAGIISTVRDSVEDRTKPVKVFISGNRPSFDRIKADSVQVAALDGRPGELGMGISVALMPVVSTHYRDVMRWRGRGPVPKADARRLRDLVAAVHAEGKKLRLWAMPDKPRVWQYLKANGVDLINTDKLEEYSEWAKSQLPVHGVYPP